MQDLDQRDDGDAEELLRRALLDAQASAAVALRVSGLPLSQTLTVVFHGRRDLGTIQTYVTSGRHRAGETVTADELLRVPCDLDLADADDLDEAERLYAEQARAMRDALLGAETVLELWRERLGAMSHGSVMVDQQVELPVRVPAPRLSPVALRAPDEGIVVTPVCEPRTLAEGRPPMGIACAQQDLARVYPLPDDPGRCLEDFFGTAADHARALADQIAHREASVERFFELNGEGPEPAP
jgi:hypothetical protein